MFSVVPCGFLCWDTYRVAYTATSASLFGDETRANHLTCKLLGILCAVAEGGEHCIHGPRLVPDLRLDDVYSALKTVGELALPSPTCKNLRLDYCALPTCDIYVSQLHIRTTHTKSADGPETLLKASMASLGVFAAIPVGVGTPY